MILISILIPVYNVEKYLPQCLQSIDMQSFKDYEVILVDDGSTDSSGRLCDNYYHNNPQRVRVIHQENQGLLGARITAIRAATGQYCLCLDSDDYWESDCLERLDALVCTHHPDMVIFNYSVLSDVTGRKLVEKPVFANEAIFTDNKDAMYERFICSTSLNALWSKLISTNLMKASLGEYANIFPRISGEDVVQSLYPVTYAKKIIYSPLPLYIYRLRNTSLVTSATDKNWIQRSDLTMRKFLRKYMDIWGYNDPVWIEKYHCMNMQLMANIIFGVLRKTTNLGKTLASLKDLCLSHFIEKDAYRYRHSRYLSLRDKIRINLVLGKRTGALGIIIKTLKKIQ